MTIRLDLRCPIIFIKFRIFQSEFFLILFFVKECENYPFNYFLCSYYIIFMVSNIFTRQKNIYKYI